MSRETHAGVSTGLPFCSSTLNAAMEPSVRAVHHRRFELSAHGPHTGARTQRVPSASCQLDRLPQIPAGNRSLRQGRFQDGGIQQIQTAILAGGDDQVAFLIRENQRRSRIAGKADRLLELGDREDSKPAAFQRFEHRPFHPRRWPDRQSPAAVAAKVKRSQFSADRESDRRPKLRQQRRCNRD